MADLDRPIPAIPTTVPPECTCVRCGYTLTALATDGDCPECGTAIARSMSDDRIADADPRWLGRVLVGLLLLAWGPVTVVVGGVLLAVASDFSTEKEAARLARPFLQALVGGGLVAAAVGGLLVTEGEPRDEDRSRPDEPRVVARWGPVVATGCATGWVVTQAGGGPPLPTFAPLLMAAAAVGVGGFALAALQLRFRELAVRIPSPTLADRCAAGHAWFRRWTGFLAALLVLRAVFDLIQQVPRLDRLTDILKLGLAIGTAVGIVVVLLGVVKAIEILDLALSVRSRIRHALAESAQPRASADSR